MTKILYMDDIEGNYIQEFDAIVIKSKKDYVAFDQTAFYPVGGGQPADTGFIKWSGNKVAVKDVIKKGDTVKHVVGDEKPPVGTRIHGVIDWERRYSHMKMHTAQHIISGIVFDEFHARTVGNQIHADYSRVDFYPVRFTDEDLVFIKNKFNEVVGKKLPVRIYEEERSVLERRVDQQRAHLDLLPKFITRLRIVEIEGFDICPCAGTHVRNTSEIPRIDKIKREIKGRDKDRIVYSLQKN
ncbi:MAG: alanyl-tRNA editing protein [Thermoplasmata archaeon]|nr:MAG: alanyl-tRNA editing protein [Thermoplasmata archaeon]